MNGFVLTVLVLLVTNAVLGGLFAQTGAGGVTVTAAGAAGTGSTVTIWGSEGDPSWTPVEGAVGVMTGGGIAHVEVPAEPSGRWNIVLFIDDPDELASAYSYWNPKVQVRTHNTAKLIPATTDLRDMVAGTTATIYSSTDITSDCSASTGTTLDCTTTLTASTAYTVTARYTYTSGGATVETNETLTGTTDGSGDLPNITLANTLGTLKSVLAVDQTAATTTGTSVQSDFYNGAVVTDAANSEVDQILNTMKGFVDITVNSSDGLCVDANGIYQSSCSSGDNRAFVIGISTPAGKSNAGTFYTTDAASSDNLSPEFTIEVIQHK